MKEKSVLERVELTGFTGGYLHRINVPGGWLVIFTNDVMSLDEQGIKFAGIEYRSGVTFYPDPNHEWKANEIKLVPTVIHE